MDPIGNRKIQYQLAPNQKFVCFHGVQYDAIRYNDIVLFGGPIPDVN